MNNTLSEIIEYINRNDESREYLLSLIKQDLGVENLDNECSHIVDDIEEIDYPVNFEDIVEAVINRITDVIESYEEEESDGGQCTNDYDCVNCSVGCVLR